MKLVHPSEIAVRLLLLLALISGSLFLKPKFIQTFTRPTPDHMVVSESRYQALIPDLPSHGVIGFISQKSLQDSSGFRSDDVYYQAAFSLAPRILTRSTAEKIIIANFPDKTNLMAELSHSPFRISKDYGNGLYLLNNRLPDERQP